MNSPTPENEIGFRILIVEPLKSFAVDLNNALENAEVTIVTTCEEAFQNVAIQKPDIILCNIHLHENGDGFDAAHRLHEAYQMPLAFFSTAPDPDGVRYALRNSPFSYTTPPFDPKRLQTLIEDTLYKFRKGIVTQKHLRDLRITDSSTALGTTQKAELALYHEWNRCTLEEAPLALLLLHLENFDDFENPNNSTAKEEALKAIAQAIQTHCARRRDVVAMDDSAQFMVLLPSTDEPGARHVAGQIVEAIHDLRLPASKLPGAPTITTSLGIAVVIPSGDKTTASLRQWAELQLDTAKRRGGNRFHGGSMQSATTPAPSAGFFDRFNSWWTKKGSDRRDLHR